jgi:hypothetical protein
MANAVIATYEDGLLKPSEKLPLSEHQQVLVVVLSLSPEVELNPDPVHVANLREQAETWLSQQPLNTAREPSAISPTTEQRLDLEFNAALTAIRRRAERFDEQRIIADVEKAAAEVHELSDAERARLDQELDDVLATIAANGIAS